MLKQISTGKKILLVSTIVFTFILCCILYFAFFRDKLEEFGNQHSFLLFILVVLIAIRVNFVLAYNRVLTQWWTLWEIDYKGFFPQLIPIVSTVQLKHAYDNILGSDILSNCSVLSSIVATASCIGIPLYLNFTVGFYIMRPIHVLMITLLIAVIFIHISLKTWMAMRVYTISPDDYYGSVTKVRILTFGLPILITAIMVIGTLLYLKLKFRFVSAVVLNLFSIAVILVVPFTVRKYSKDFYECLIEQNKN